MAFFEFDHSPCESSAVRDRGRQPAGKKGPAEVTIEQIGYAWKKGGFILL